MLPFSRVSACRRELALTDKNHGNSDAFIDSRTLRRRIQLVLTSNGIILKKLSHKLSCYVSANIMEKPLSAMALSKCAKIFRTPRPSVSHVRDMLKYVGNYFQSHKERYWKGDWTLSDEIAAIPSDLWTDIVINLVSDRRLSLWKVTGLSTGKMSSKFFPLCNDSQELPSPSIEEALNNPRSDYSRANILIAVRAMKIIEQQVISRTNGVAGPLTISLSVAGICEVSPSFVSVLNAMGLFLSYGTTEAYRQKLIAGRERLGAWDTSNMNAVAIPTFQFDNWDIKPSHAVKVDGKAMPKVNGSLLQAHTRKRKGSTDLHKEGELKRQRTSLWKGTSLLGNREEFAQSFQSTKNDICDLSPVPAATHGAGL